MVSVAKGRTYAEFKALLQEGYKSDLGAFNLSPLKPYADQIWDAIVFAEHNDSLIMKLELSEKKQFLLDNLLRFQKYVDLLLACHNKKLKKWKALGEDYRRSIILQLQPILLEELDGFRIFFQRATDEPALHHDSWDYVVQCLDKLPSPDSLHVDRSGIIPTQTMINCSHAVKKVISATKALIKNERKSYEKYFPGEVSRAIFNTGVPKEREFFELTYWLLDWMGLIPEKTRRDHETAKNPDCRSDYIRAFVNIGSKHRAK